MDEITPRLKPYLERARQLAPLITELSDRADREAQMPQEIADAFHEAGFFRILLPSSMNGGGFTIPESLGLVEEVSAIDGSAGWNLGICSGGPLFGHNLPRAAFEKIFGDPRGVSVGSLNPMTSRATSVDGGWRFSGKATYCSGSAHATYLCAAGIIVRDGAPQMDQGFPAIRAGLFSIREAKILETWSTAGMRGTGSNDCIFENVFVRDEFTFDWLKARSPWQTGAFLNIPFPLQIAGVLGATILGTAGHALRALREIAQAKIPAASRAALRERPIAQTQYAQAEGLLGAARAYFYQASHRVWSQGESGEAFSDVDRAQVRLAIVTAVKLALQVVDLVADAAGMNAVLTSSPIERCWRDAHTASQHVLMNTARFEVIGRVLFGLDPGSPVI
jgi:alkylation response protein AidB-like acyl-CoA dehydrogenase